MAWNRKSKLIVIVVVAVELLSVLTTATVPQEDSSLQKHRWWLQAIKEVIGVHFRERQFPSQITYGSDCSGIDAPMWAMSQLVSEIFKDGHTA